MMEGNTEQPAGIEPLLAKANLARIRGQWNEAVDTCVQVLRTHPGNADAHSLLGDIYRDQGAIDDAIQWYRMAADLRTTGPDGEKLRKLELERERRAALSGPLNAAVAAGAYETGSGGTTQLMGQSPRRWLNTLTIVSACFLAATVIVLAVLRTSPPGRGDPLPRTMELPSQPMMPTAETGVALPRINPNRPAILPIGEQPKAPARVHQTGEGLQPDHPGVSMTAPLPAFSHQSSAEPVGSLQANIELPPARVQRVKPFGSTVSVAPYGSPGPSDLQNAGQPRSRTIGAAGLSEDRDSSGERDPSLMGGAAKPASESNAGEQNTGGGGVPPER